MSNSEDYGRSSYQLKMMLKVILFAYQKIYSYRGIEILIQENIPAIWLARSKRLISITLISFVDNW